MCLRLFYAPLKKVSYDTYDAFKDDYGVAGSTLRQVLPATCRVILQYFFFHHGYTCFRCLHPSFDVCVSQPP